MKNEKKRDDSKQERTIEQIADGESALLWYGDIREKINEINQLYSRLWYAINYLDKEQIKKLKNELHKLSIANLNCIIHLHYSSIKRRRDGSGV